MFLTGVWDTMRKMYVPISPYKKKSVTADSGEELIREYLITHSSNNLLGLTLSCLNRGIPTRTERLLPM